MPAIALGAQQLEALDKVEVWHHQNRRRYPRESLPFPTPSLIAKQTEHPTFVRHMPYFYLAGYAGTGKSTILPRLIRDACGLKDSEVVVCSLTAQAARVASAKMRKVGLGVKTSTLHGLLYQPTMKRELLWEDDGTPTLDPLTGTQLFKRTLDFVSREGLSRNNATLRKVRLIIVDEAPMAGQRVLGDLFSLGIPVLLLGDKAQLPSIGVEREHHVDFDNPHHELTDVFRQDGDSYVARVADAVRNGYIIEYGTYGAGEFVAMNYASFHSDPERRNRWMLAADQILVATNKMRHTVNATMRQLKGYTDILHVGDKLICLKNSKDTFIGSEQLTNGMIAYVEHIHSIDLKNSTAIVTLSTENPDGGTERELVAIHLGALGHSRTGADMMKMARHKRKKHQPDLGVFDYAYAITCHKAQGSEWNHVIILYEPLPDLPYPRWVYPAATRACVSALFVSDIGSYPRAG